MRRRGIPNKIGGRPINWEANAKRFHWNIIFVGMLVILVIGVPLLWASYNTPQVLDWFRSRGWNVVGLGYQTLRPGQAVTAFRIVGGVFSIIGAGVMWVGLPMRSKK